MDPASIVGIVSSVVGIADVVTRSIRSLNSLKTKYRDTPLIVSTLIGQLFTTQVALQQLSSWAEDYPRKSAGSEGGRYPELVAQVGSALDCFGPLVVSLQRDLDQFEGSNKTSMSFTRRMSFLWNERDLNDYLGLLDRQVNALTLLLQAIQCKTQDQQRELLAEKESQTVLRRARDCRSSLVGFDEITGNDGNDGTSIVSEGMTALSVAFDFDAILMSSRAYQTAQRSLIRQLVNNQRDKNQSQEVSAENKSALQTPEENETVERNAAGVANSEGLSLPVPYSDDPKEWTPRCGRHNLTLMSESTPESLISMTGSNVKSSLRRQLPPRLPLHINYL